MDYFASQQQTLPVDRHWALILLICPVEYLKGMLHSPLVSLLVELVYQRKWDFPLLPEVVVRIFLHKDLVVTVHYRKDSCCP